MELNRSTLTEQVYAILRDRILSGDEAPGSRVDIGLICDELGVSQTPVVSALKRLRSDGLVEIHPRQGTYVRWLGADDIRELFEIRMMIEVWAAESATRNASSEDDLFMETTLKRMQACVDGDGYRNFKEFLSYDSTLHGRIVDLAGNGRLSEIYRSVKLNSSLLGAQIARPVQDARATASEHQAMVHAFKERNCEKLASAIRTHEENRAKHWLTIWGEEEPPGDS
jgi:DNA-binding GntR family transcriptional regulator